MRTKVEILAEADSIARQTTYSREDKSRFDSLMMLAEQLGELTPAIYAQRARNAAGLPPSEARASMPSWFAKILRFGEPGLNLEERTAYRVSQQTRALDSTGTFPGSGGGVLVPLQFENQLFQAARQVDALLDPAVTTVIETPSGAPVAVPNWDFTQHPAAKVAQGAQSTVHANPLIGNLQLATAPTYRTDVAVTSIELDEDSRVNLETKLVDAFALSIALGAGADLVGAMLAQMSTGIVAAGAKTTDGVTGHDGGSTVGYDDLLSAIGAIDEAYLASPKAGWLMRRSTLVGLWGVKDAAGRPVMHPKYDPLSGKPLLLGFPVHFCPSLAAIGAHGSPPVAPCPILFGDLSRIVVRIVKGSTRVQRLFEAPGYVENGLMGFLGFARIDGGLQNSGAATPPLVYIANV